MIRFALGLALALTALPAAAQTPATPPPPLLHAMFQDHAVLQRDRPISLWGRAAPGESVRLTLAGNSAEAKAGKDGIWRATLPALAAGGPYALVATTGPRTQTVGDVLIGDVWLCSGQSNMAWPVSASFNGQTEVNNAKDADVRILTIQNDVATSPQLDFKRPVEWKQVSPATIGNFSAACWFMARELRKTQKVPFGLINASWGGTAINAWRSEASMKGETALANQLALLTLSRNNPAKAAAVWGETWATWWRGKSGDTPGKEPWQPSPAGEWKPVPALDYWEQWGVPEFAGYNGLIWFRTQVTLTAAQAKKGATLGIGVIDDLDMSYVNGVGVGATSSWDVNRVYRLAPGVLKPGVNIITIAAFDSWGPGGMGGASIPRGIAFDDGTGVPLPDASGWQYRAAPGVGEPPHAPWESAAGLGSIYNAMIAPLGTYGLKGVAWYQGESDAGISEGYAGRLTSLMGGWRTQFGQSDLPFLIVQLPDWGARVTAPAESGFAEIRDEQRRGVMADSRAALVVTVDAGDPADLHPQNKQVIGVRLARAGNILVYGAPGFASGPLPGAMAKGGDSLTIPFTGIDGSLLTYNGSQVLGFELCGPARGSCRFTTATVEGNAIRVRTDAQPVSRVRFCWGESPLCNLYDKTGLPVTPFELKLE